MSKRIGGTIENWRIIDYFGNSSDVIVGTVYGDDNWPDGFYLRTSLIVNISEDKTEVETLNTVYKLGKPYQEATE